MLEVYEKGVSTNENVSFEVDLAIPGIAMNSNNRFCNVVQITYELFIGAQISGCHKNIEMSIPVTIGSVPLDFNRVEISNEFNLSFPSAPPAPISAPIPDLRERFNSNST